VDRLAGEASPPQRERIASAFLTSSRYEYLFWDASYRLEQWPV
jgi:thiaminase/transcriptional activator TenA